MIGWKSLAFMLKYKKKNDMMISKVFLYKKSLKNMSIGLMKNNRKDLNHAR